MANLIQIKRSESTATPGSLANGELAFSAASNVLFIGMQNTVVPIAGGRSPGTLVANQAIVVNASSLIDTINVGNTGTNVTTNTSGIYLANSTSNTRLTIPSTAEWTSGSYWLNANGQWSTIPAAATSLDGLNDVTITTVSNNQFLVYDDGTSQWVNKSAGNGFAFSAQAPYILANNGIIANTTGIWVDEANGVVVTSDGVNVLANNGIVSNTTGVWVKSANGITVTTDGVNVLAGNSQIVSNTTGIWVTGITTAQITDDIVLGTKTSGDYVASITAGDGFL
jgi:hypothetical protein